MRSTIFAGLLGAAIGCGPREGDTTTLREAQVQNTPSYQAAQADPMVHPDDPDNRTLPREGYLDDYRQPPTTPQGRLDDAEDDDDRDDVPQSTLPNRDDDGDGDGDGDDDADVDTPDVEIHGEATAPDLDLPDVDAPDIDTPDVDVNAEATAPDLDVPDVDRPDVDVHPESSTSGQVPAVPPDIDVPVDHDTPDPW